MIQLSVIIPVFNVENYLSECLDSLLPQWRDDVEIIVVNDGSTDGSADILDLYGRQFPHLIILQQENRGLAGARNTGLKIAAGNFIWFVDSDDLVANNAVSRLREVSRNSPVDMIRFGYTKFDSTTGETLKKTAFSAASSVLPLDYFRNRKMQDEVCMAVYRRNFIEDNRLQFAEGFYFEDTIFNLQAYHSDCKMVVLEDILYFYRQRRDSIMAAGSNSKKILSVAKIIETCDEIIKTRSKENAQLAVLSKLNSFLLIVEFMEKNVEMNAKRKRIFFKNLDRWIPVLNSDNKFDILLKKLLYYQPQLFYKFRVYALKKGLQGSLM